jgi:hypothetical protein
MDNIKNVDIVLDGEKNSKYVAQNKMPYFPPEIWRLIFSK